MIRFGAIAATAVAVFFAASLAVASARDFGHGKTVWFSDLSLGDGDTVHGNLDVVFGNVACLQGAEIDGDVRTFFGSFTQEDGCFVDGQIASAFDSDSVPWLGPLTSADALGFTHGLGRKLAWDAVVLFAFLIFPVRVRTALDRVERHPALSAATGAIVVVAMVPAAVLMALTIVGIPLIPLEVALIFAALWIGNAAIALLIGRRLHELVRPTLTPTPVAALGVGLLAITVGWSLPVVGWAVMTLVLLAGLGAAVLAFVRESSFRSVTQGRSSDGAALRRSASP